MVPRQRLAGIFLVAYFLGYVSASKSPVPTVTFVNSGEDNLVKRSDFPSDFLFGASTSAAQSEGSTTIDGRGPSIWDYHAQRHPERFANGSNMNTATDSYKRWKEDMGYLKQLGVNSFRFSISWTRILPDGTLKGGANMKAIRHYNKIINTLIKYGIKPVVTMFHFDSPQHLQEAYGGFLSKKIITDFNNYAEICFREFGDRVKTWITINEPFIISRFGYDKGVAAPGRCSDRTICDAGNSATEPYLVTHHLLLAHATAVKLYRDKFQPTQKGEIGLSIVGNHFEPYSDSAEDKIATQRVVDFELGWNMDPLVNGDYPQEMKKIVRDRLPKFTAEEKILLKGSFDFIGVNYYTARYVKNIPVNLNAPPVSYFNDRFANGTEVNANGVPIGPHAEGSAFIFIHPQGLQKLLEYIKVKYQNPKIYITENGVTELNSIDRPLEEALNDQHRIKFIQDHLYYIRSAMRNGANVKGYMYWCFTDDFEWQEGYVPRFGLFYINYKDNLNRIPKKSAVWYHDFITGKTL